MSIDGTPEHLQEWQQVFAKTLVSEGFCALTAEAMEYAINHTSELNHDNNVAAERDPVLDAYDYIRDFFAHA